MSRPKREEEASEKHFKRPEDPKTANPDEPHKSQQVKFGPIRIKFADPNKNYKKIAFLSVCNGISQMMIGAINIFALSYTMKTGDYHVALCTTGWHLFTIQAIIAVNYTKSWATAFSTKHKRLIHLMFQICSIIFIITGSVLVLLVVNAEYFEAHGIVGLVGLSMTVVTVTSGPAAFFVSSNSNVTLFHVFVALPTFVITSACLCLGLLKPSIREWAGSDVPYVLVGFVVFYTIFFVTTAIYKVK